MKLYYFCKSCKRENGFTVKSNNRFDLQKEKGKHISERCPECGTITERHINRIHAKPRYYRIALIFMLAIVISYFLFEMGWIAGLTFILPIILWKEEVRYASTFNRVMIND